MCKTCKFWQVAEAYDAAGIMVAPCALKPDMMVKDRRVPGGLILQAYVTQDDYECVRYEKVAP